MRVERITWDYEDGKYSIKYLMDGKYLVCTDDRTCFIVCNTNDNINEIINAVEEYAKAELF